MTIEKRWSRRIPYRYAVKFGISNPPEHTAFVVDLSDTGIWIKTNRVYPKGTRLFLRIDTDKGSFEGEGIVTWSKRVPPAFIRTSKCGMGIKFLNIDERLLKDFYRKSGTKEP